MATPRVETPITDSHVDRPTTPVASILHNPNNNNSTSQSTNPPSLQTIPVENRPVSPNISPENDLSDDDGPVNDIPIDLQLNVQFGPPNVQQTTVVDPSNFNLESNSIEMRCVPNEDENGYPQLMISPGTSREVSHGRVQQSMLSRFFRSLTPICCSGGTAIQTIKDHLHKKQTDLQNTGEEPCQITKIQIDIIDQYMSDSSTAWWGSSDYQLFMVTDPDIFVSNHAEQMNTITFKCTNDNGQSTYIRWQDATIGSHSEQTVRISTGRIKENPEYSLQRYVIPFVGIKISDFKSGHNWK